MHFTSLLVGGLAAVAHGRVLGKRAAVDDAASVGYATLNGGTTGGAGGTTVTVTTADELADALTADGASIVQVTGSITGAQQIEVTSDKTLIGMSSAASIEGIGLYIKGVSNVIVRNIAISKVLAENGDAIGIQASTNVWVDHVDLSSDRDHDKDYYDGLLDVTHACDYVTVTNSYLHDHWKASLVGHSDSNGDEDTGHLTVTYANNYFENLNSRGPSYRFGTGHIFNNYYNAVSDGINTRDGAQLLVESNVFVDSDKPLYSTDDGYAVSNDNDFGSGENTAEEGTLTSMTEYDYTLLGSANVKAAVVGVAGATLSF